MTDKKKKYYEFLWYFSDFPTQIIEGSVGTEKYNPPMASL